MAPRVEVQQGKYRGAGSSFDREIGPNQDAETIQDPVASQVWQGQPQDKARSNSIREIDTKDIDIVHVPETPAILLNNPPPVDLDTKGSQPHPFSEYRLPGVRFCHWFDFKNRYAEEDYSQISIEALVGPSDLNNDMGVDEYRRLMHRTGVEVFPPGLADYRPPRTTTDAILHRVRLHSPAVLSRLSSIMQSESDWSRQPTTFMRPFREFIHYHDTMKLELKRVEGLAAQTPSLREDYEDVLAYINFVEKVILPLKSAWDPGSPDIPSKIRHSDLYYIFRPGELVYCKLSGDSYRNEPNPPPAIRMHMASATSITTRRDNSGSETFVSAYSDYTIWFYRIDFDGSTFRPIIEAYDIWWYPGEAEIHSLDCYPLRFEKNADKILAESHEYGKTFTTFCTGKPHWFHSGWTIANFGGGQLALARHAFGREKEPGLNSEFIDSEVIIDFREAMKALHWSPGFRTLEGSSRASATTKTDLWNILTWANPQSTKTVSTVSEIVIVNSELEKAELKDMATQNAILRNGIAETEDLSELHLSLLPRRVFVYSLRDRQFVGAHIDSLTAVRNTDGGFHNLRINPSHLRMIKSLVKNHFDTKKLEEKKPDLTGQDFIHGKGRGVVVLLHGVPGTGKTATAEAVAQEYSKPLFPITCGDLGTTPEAVSKSLMNIFRLASLWGCVLLLDEADVFLSRREQKGDDLVRNALVSGKSASSAPPQLEIILYNTHLTSAIVFLRVLEYYNGILFLTTNRPGTFDEAVKSRVHASFYYSALDWEQTRDIFKLNIERLQRIQEQRAEAGGERLTILSSQIMRFAEDHYHAYTDHEGRWNGRQIRNAFQIAAGLAHLDGDDETTEQSEGDRAQKQLGRLQFQEVADAIVNYDRFRVKVLGKYDDEIARDRMERPAHHWDQDRPRGSGYGGSGGVRGAWMRDRDLDRDGYLAPPSRGSGGGGDYELWNSYPERHGAGPVPRSQENWVRRGTRRDGGQVEEDEDNAYGSRGGRYGSNKSPVARDREGSRYSAGKPPGWRRDGDRYSAEGQEMLPSEATVAVGKAGESARGGYRDREGPGVTVGRERIDPGVASRKELSGPDDEYR